MEAGATGIQKLCCAFVPGIKILRTSVYRIPYTRDSFLVHNTTGANPGGVEVMWCGCAGISSQESLFSGC